MRAKVVFIVALVLLACSPALGAVKDKKFHKANFISEHSGNDFFDAFDFWTYDDPTHGYVNYVDVGTAWYRKLIKVNEIGQVVMKADDSNVASGRGRDSVRLHSKQDYNSGLFILDVAHIPSACGAWPAFWLCGPDWPTKGEIDILEYVNDADRNMVTLHTNSGCDMSSVPDSSFSGSWSTGAGGQPAKNCDVNAPGQYANQGCGQVLPYATAGGPFNNQGGGVYAVNWNPNSGIRTWFFPRNNIPADIRSGNPNVSSWGKPASNFQFGGQCPNWKFQSHKIIFNLTFCGDWAGSVFGQQCPGKGSCTDYVKYNPSAFHETYWLINYLKVFSAQ